MVEMAQALVVPWMRRRNGIATKDEVVERMQRVAVNSECVEPFLALVSDLAGDLGEFLEQPMAGVFCSDRWIAAEFKAVIACCRSFFVNRDVYYPIDQLVRLVLREFAKDWQALSESFVLQALTCCDAFHVRIDASGKRIVRLS
jgi:hypothetical protein